MIKAYRLTASGIVFFGRPKDEPIKQRLENPSHQRLDELKETLDIAIQELQEQSQLDTIKITLEEIKS